MTAFMHFGSVDAPLGAATPVAAAAVSALISAAWQGAVLAAGVALALRLVPRMSAACRSVVWVNVFGLILAMHVLPYVRPASGLVGRTPALHLSWNWCLGLVGLWAALFGVRGFQLVSSALRLRALAKLAVPVEPDAAVAELLQVKTIFGKVTRRAELCRSGDVHRPSVLGFVHPRILFPQALLKRLTTSELQQVIMHEMEHLRRADDWTNLLQKIALAVFPLNPALFWVERRLCAERELACDDSVLRSSGGRKAYAICLTHLAEYSMLRRSLSLALGAWERQSELVQRVHRILGQPGETLNRRQSLALTGGLAVVVLGGALGLSRSPELVGFADPQVSFAQNSNAGAGPDRVVGSAEAREVRGVSNAVEGHVQLAKATMPGPWGAFPTTNQTVRRNVRAVVQRRKVAALRAVKQERVERPRQAWVVMTQWSGAGSAQSLVWAVQQDSTGSIAAIRTASGWLFIQI